MREILFRGKRKDNGEWVYGSYAYQYGCHQILLEKSEGEYGFDNYHIIPETVGQFTGLTDKNGVKIFEGDIVKGFIYRTSYIAETKFLKSMFCFKLPVNISLNFDGYTDVEVIGNVHDNPELLKGEEK